MELYGNCIYDGERCVAVCENGVGAKALETVLKKAEAYDRLMEKVGAIPDEGVSSHFDITYITHHDLRIGGDDNGNGGYILHTKCITPVARDREQRNVDIPFMCRAANLLVELKAESYRGSCS